MEQADKERNRLLLVEHTHTYNTRPFSKTHWLMLAIQIRRGTIYFWSNIPTYNTRPFSKSHPLMLTTKQADMRETGYFWSNIHTYKTQDH